MSSRHTVRSHAARLVLATALLALGIQPFANAQDDDAPAAEPTSAAVQPVAPAQDKIAPEPTAEPSAEPDDALEPTPEVTAEASPEPAGESASGSPDEAPVPEDDVAAANDAETAVEPEQAPPTEPTPASPGAKPATAKAAAAVCPPTDRTNSITSITVAPTIVAPNDIVTVNFSAVMRDGGCEGDFIDLVLPPQIAGLSGSFPITAPDGSVIATMVVSAGRALITFNDYLEYNTNVSFQGNLKARVRVSVEPDTTYDMEWPTGNEVFVTPITTVDCPNCGPGEVRTRKFAEYEAGPPPFVRFAISSVATQTAGEVVTFTDTVDPGHQIDCSSLTMLRGTTVDAWGNVQFNFTVPPANYTIVSCTATTTTVQIIAGQVGRYFRLEGRSIPTVVQTLYSDRATVTQAGVTTAVRASARLTDGGGQVDGTRRVPRVNIEKWSTDDGPKAGDFDDDYKNLDPNRAEKITFTITNRGNEILNNIRVSDRTTAGKGVIKGLTCDFSRLGGPSSGTTWAGPFDIDDSFTCTGRLPALGKNARHTDRAKVTAVGRATTTTVTDTDDWNGQTRKGGNPPPGVDIEKWSTEDGPRAGDYDNTSKPLQVDEETDLTFTITNRGKEPLVDIVVRDKVIAGSASVSGLTCDFSRLGGPSSGTRWEGPLKRGDSFRCTATLTGVKAGEQHTDRASVTATGQNSGKTTRDTDRWNGKVYVGGLPEVGLSSRIAPTAGIGLLLALTGFWLLRRRSSHT